MKTTVFTFLLFATISPINAQSVYAALNGFLSQDFFSEYDVLCERAEDAVRQFKFVQHKYSASEIADVKNAYNASANYFNAVVLNIKNDLLNKQKRKFMIQFPEDYAKQVEADLFRAREFYETNFQKEIVQVTNGEITGLAFLALLPELIGYAKTAFAAYKKIKAEMAKFNESLLQKQLVEPYTFRMWDEIN
jgi:hypothetical protein